jgi:large subunit ribosomal protein L6
MSRIGKQPVLVPGGITAEITDSNIKVKGAKSELVTPYNNAIVGIGQADGKITVTLKDPEQGAYHGLMRKLIFNMVKGVQTGFEKKLEINGVGYKAQLQGSKLTFNLGFSHPVEVAIPEGITVEIADNTKMTIKGANKGLVGLFAARLRAIRPPEPYQGKGIKYDTEVIRRKVGKTGA